jgi:hypothetical protein
MKTATWTKTEESQNGFWSQKENEANEASVQTQRQMRMLSPGRTNDPERAALGVVGGDEQQERLHSRSYSPSLYLFECRVRRSGGRR